MIRNLAVIAAASLVVSTAALSAAFFIAGPENVLNHGAWTYGPHSWGGHWGRHAWRADRDEGPQTSREIAWAGGDALSIEFDADVRYTQAPGPARVTVTGPRDAVAEVEMVDGQLRYAKDSDHDGRLTVVVSAPAVTHFTLESSGRLDIAGYKQDALTVALNGDGDAKAAGEAQSVKLTLSGSGDADLAALKSQTAEVLIEGSGSAKLAPTNAAKVSIEGSGDVHLLTNPPKLSTHVAGSGEVTLDNPPAAGD